MADSVPGSTTLMAMFTGIVGVAMVAIIISQKANSAAVIQSLSSGIGNVIGAAVAPVTGNSTSNNAQTPTG